MSVLPPPPQDRRIYLGEPPPVETEPDPDPPSTGTPVFPAIQHLVDLDTWVLRYDPAHGDLDTPSDPLPEGDFSLVVTVTKLPEDPQAGVGLFLHNEDDGPVYLLASSGGDGKVPVHLMLVYLDDGFAHCYRSDDGLGWTWCGGGPLGRPTTGGLVLRYGGSGTPVSAQAARYRVLDGVLDLAPKEVGI